MLYTLELYSHVTMQRDVGRTCNVDCTGLHPLKTIGKKPVDVATRWVKKSEENLDDDSPYVLVCSDKGFRYMMKRRLRVN